MILARCVSTVRQYLQHPEVKSLASDGGKCVSRTEGLLRRETIVGKKLVSIGKETDRSWDQGGDPSVLDFKLKEYDEESKMVIAYPPDRIRWTKLGPRHLNAQVRPKSETGIRNH
jgi:hypothetical protein